MSVNVKENNQVSPFFLLFLIYGVQVGVGILSYESMLVKDTGNDSWVPVIFAGITMQIVLWLMFRLLERSDGDIIAIHKQLFGKWIGGFLTVIVSFYFLIMSLVVLMTYTELVQVWIFPQISYWQIGGIVAVTAYAFLLGGFRSLTGITFLSIVYSSPLFVTFFFPLPFLHYDNLMPLFQHSPLELILSTQKMILNFEGFGLILLFYPFIKEPKKAKKWAHYGIFITTGLYILVLLITLTYYNVNEMEHILWPTVELWKIVDFPFMERFEYIGITIWLFVIMPNLCLTLWGASRGLKRQLNFNHKYTALVMLLLIYIAGYFIDNYVKINKLNSLLSNFGFFFLCVYIPFLYIFQSIVLKVKKSHVQA